MYGAEIVIENLIVERHSEFDCELQPAQNSEEKAESMKPDELPTSNAFTRE